MPILSFAHLKPNVHLKKTAMRVIVVLLLAFAFTNLFAQDYKLESSVVSANKVQIKLLVKDRKNPPDSLVGIQTKEPFWSLFLIYGDGAYDSIRVLPFSSTIVDSFEVFTYEHNYREAGTFRPEALMTAVYSRDRNSRVAAPPVTTSTPLSPVDWTPFTGEYSGKTLKLASSWRSARPEDTLIVAISYARPESISASSGEISLSFDQDIFSWAGPAFAGQVPTLKSAGIDGDDYRITWDFSGYGPTEKHKTFFVRLAVPKDLSLENFTEGISTQLNLGIKWNEVLAESEGQRSSLLDAVVIVAGPKSRDVPNVKTEEYTRGSVFDETVVLGIEVNTSNDPNGIEIQPRCFLANRSYGQTGRISVHFMNTGSAGARRVGVRTNYNTTQWTGTRLTGSFKYRPNRSDITVNSTNGAGFFLDTYVSRDNSTLLTSVEEIQAAGGVAGGRDELSEYIGGYIAFSMNTLPNLRAGDSLRMTATVYMDADSVPHYRAVPICRYCGPKVRWHYGLKYLVDFPGTDLLTRGHGLRLTLSKPLGRMLEPVESPSIPLSQLPVWWLQWEAGISARSLEQSNGDSLRLKYIDVVPFQIRWIPKAGLGNLSKFRRIGLSAGYTFSYLYDGSIGEASFEAKPENKIDHTIGVSLDYGNILLRPGLSFGVGYNYRWTRYNGSPQNYGHAFVYVHLNLPYRLRFN